MIDIWMNVFKKLKSEFIIVDLTCSEIINVHELINRYLKFLLW